MPHDFIPTLIGYALGWALYCWFWWFVISKFGWRGKARFILLALMAIPPTHPALTILSSGYLIFMLAWPWPIHQELRQLKKQREVKAQDEIDLELQRLKKL
jgi:hypothetical protein